MTCALQDSMASSLRPRANPRGFSASPNQIQTKNKTGQSPALFLAEGEGFAPLAVRPGAQPTGLVQFALQLSEIDLDAQTARSRSRLHPRIPHQTKFKPKIRQGKALSYFWRKVRDSNPRMLSHQRFSSFIPRLLSAVYYCCLTARIVGKSAF